MKIVFLGTPEFAVPSLDILVQNDYTIAGVVTAPGRKAGRGMLVRQPAVKLYADKSGLRTFQPEKLSDPDFQNELKSLQADLFIVVAFRMLPESVWTMPPLGTFNLHSSLLPQYRGAAPINRAIMNGATQTGVTTFFLKHEIDTGNIILQESVSISPDETAGELHDRLMLTGAQLVLKTVKQIADGSVKEISQTDLIGEGEPLLAAPKIFTADCNTNWFLDAATIHNHIRGLSPFPGAFTHLVTENGSTLLLKLYRSRLTNRLATGEPGTLTVENDQLFIQCSDFQIEILELKLEGKKKNNAFDFIRGFRQLKNCKAVFEK